MTFYLSQLSMLIVTFIWGCTFIIVQEALNDALPFSFATLRFGSASIILLLIVLFNVKSKIRFDEIYGGAICGVALFAGYSFQNFGLLYTTASKSAFITGTSVVMVPYLLYFFLKEKIKFQIWIAVLFVVIGLYFLLNPRVEQITIGDILTFGCAFSFAVHILFQDHYIKKECDIINLFCTQAIVVTILSLFNSFIFESEAIIWSSRLFYAILITSIFGTVIAFYLMLWSQKILDANQTAIICSFEPVFAALFAMVYAQEYLSFTSWIGGIIIIFGLIIMNIKPIKLHS